MTKIETTIGRQRKKIVANPSRIPVPKKTRDNEERSNRDLEATGDSVSPKASETHSARRE